MRAGGECAEYVHTWLRHKDNFLLSEKQKKLGQSIVRELTGREILLKPKASSNFAFLGTLVGLNLLGSSSHSQSLQQKHVRPSPTPPTPVPLFAHMTNLLNRF